MTSSPNSYSLYTKAQYDANYTNGYNAGKTVNKKCVYGSTTVYVSGMAPVTTSVSFNYTYASIPTMKFVVEYSDCYISSYSASTTGCTIVVGHTKGNDKHNCVIYWLAEGN